MQNRLSEMPVKRIYLDNNATTFPSPLLRERWMEVLDVCGNPSSVHNEGRMPKQILRDCRNKIAKILNCSPHEIVFNSGASEGNATVLKSVYNLLKKSRNEFLIGSTEHPSIMKAVKYLEQSGAIIKKIPVSRFGEVDLEFIKNELSEKTALVSCMYANNETGVVYPIQTITQLAHDAGALMHSDCVQLLGKSGADLKTLNLDYATFSAHKFYALKGTGFCFVKSQAPWEPLIFGSQERARRGGTENVTGIAAMNIVLDEFENIESKSAQMKALRDAFEKTIKQKISGIRVTGESSTRLPNTSNIMIDGVDGDTMLMSLDMKGLSISTGAACSSGSPDPSPVLLAMGFTREEAQTSLRISFGWDSKQEDVSNSVNLICEVVEKLRNLNAKTSTREV